MFNGALVGGLGTGSINEVQVPMGHITTTEPPHSPVQAGLASPTSLLEPHPNRPSNHIPRMGAPTPTPAFHVKPPYLFAFLKALGANSLISCMHAHTPQPMSCMHTPLSPWPAMGAQLPPCPMLRHDPRTPLAKLSFPER